jgi:hypothetical protein
VASIKHMGSCHCGAVAFSVELTDGFANLRRCNCTLCKRKGAVMASVPIGDLAIIRGADKLASYQWNTRTAKHFFCSTCGIYTHHHQRRPPGMVGFNVACIEGVDPYSLGEIPISNGSEQSVVGDGVTPKSEPNKSLERTREG